MGARRLAGRRGARGRNAASPARGLVLLLGELRREGGKRHEGLRAGDAQPYVGAMKRQRPRGSLPRAAVDLVLPSGSRREKNGSAFGAAREPVRSALGG